VPCSRSRINAAPVRITVSFDTRTIMRAFIDIVRARNRSRQTFTEEFLLDLERCEASRADTILVIVRLARRELISERPAPDYFLEVRRGD
jgi:hypothetical protein